MDNRHRSAVVAVAVVVMAGLLLASCGNDSPNAADVSSKAIDTRKPVRIGGTLPLTGVFSDTGCWIERGYRYWAEEVNGKGGLLGRPVELIIHDDAGDPERAVSLFEQVIVRDKADLLLGGYPGIVAAIQMSVAERRRMVYVSMGGHMHSFEQGFTYSFGAPPLMGQWWYQGFWEWLATLPETDRPRRMATITVNNVVGLSIRESALDGAARMGIELVMDELYDLPLSYAKEFVAVAKASGADLFVASGFLPDGILTRQAMKSLGYNPAFFLQAIGSHIPRWREELGNDADYVFSGAPILAGLPFPGVKAINDAVNSRFEVSEAPCYFLFGIAWLQTLQAGVEGAGSLNQTAIRDYLRSHTVSTIGGKYTFDKRGLPKPFSYLTQVQPTGVELIHPLEVRTAEPVYPATAARH